MKTRVRVLDVHGVELTSQRFAGAAPNATFEVTWPVDQRDPPAVARVVIDFLDDLDDVRQAAAHAPGPVAVIGVDTVTVFDVVERLAAIYDELRTAAADVVEVVPVSLYETRVGPPLERLTQALRDAPW